MQKTNRQKNLNLKKKWYQDARTYFVGLLFLLMLMIILHIASPNKRSLYRYIPRYIALPILHRVR